MNTKNLNPGGGTKYCKTHGNVWLHNLVHISDKPIIKASTDYVDTIRSTCCIFGAMLIDKVVWEDKEGTSDAKVIRI